MKLRRIRIQVALLLFILLPAMAGVVAVHASAACERLVHTYVTKPVRNAVSQQTASAWARWRINHPNWKPNPRASRPKYVMTREEAVDKVGFACTVENETVTKPQSFVTESKLPDPPLITLPTTPGEPEISFPTVVSPELAMATPLVDLSAFPYRNAFVGGSTPEPSTLMLTGSGVCLMLLLLRSRSRPIEA